MIKESIFLLIFILINLINFNCNAADDLFSSVTALQKNLNTEIYMFEKLDNFIFQSERKLLKLKRYFNDYQAAFQHSRVSNQTIKLFGPIDKFIETTKFLKIRKSIESLMFDFRDYDSEVITTIDQYPCNSDFEGIIKGLARLQHVYDMNVADILNIALTNSQRVKITTSDYFYIGAKMHLINENKLAFEWLTESLNQIDAEDGIFKKPVSRSKILQFLAMSKWNQGGIENTKLSIKYARDALKLEPNRQTILSMIDDLKWPSNISDYSAEPYLLEKKYKLGCQGKYKKSPKELSQLYCFLNQENHLFLKLAPIKMEFLSLDPRIILVHDAIFENEIKKIIKMARDKLGRAETHDLHTGKSLQSDYRISKVVFFCNNTDSLIHSLNQRTFDISGLSMELGEDLQVLNYGIGGHYAVHNDAFPEPDSTNGFVPFPFYDQGNRIATLLFYLSDVEKGGATVFPNVEVATFPEKGKAILWYSLHHDGSIDERTAHAGCPVLAGSKWASNKWIRFKDQIFLRPCSIKKK